MSIASRSSLGWMARLFVLPVVAAWVLVAFIRPCGPHNGLNQYERAPFLDLVHGTAYHPYVNRALLPATVRVIAAATPLSFQRALTDRVRNAGVLAEVFDELHWEPEAAWAYSVATLLMWGCFAGFGFFAARLCVRTCGVPDTDLVRAGLGAAALLGLLPLFTYNSFPYDPPQLLLFTMALDALAGGSGAQFWGAFLLCCANKETAILLIPIALTTTSFAGSKGRSWRLGGLLVGAYLVIRLGIGYAFRSAPGATFEFHLLRNLRWFTHGWVFNDLVDLLVIVALLAFAWPAKPDFLKRAFVWTLPPLAIMALFLGFIDEWRGYYEAYPVAFALIVDTLRRLPWRGTPGRVDAPARSAPGS